MNASRSTRPDRAPQVHLVARVAGELLEQIRSGALAPGTRLPSVRQLARDRHVSTFSAAEIYNALVATGAVEAHGGRGYFVAHRPGARLRTAAIPESPADSVWERRREAAGQPIELDAGCGWLPGAWLYEEGVRSALRAVARRAELHMEGYGSPLGLEELRAHLCTILEARSIAAREDQIVLTQGASQALHLVVHECLQPGDLAIVEDPGYPPIFEMLASHGIQMLAIPRTDQGPDVEALAKILKRRRARWLFTNTTCQNPTGTTTSLSTAHRLLELAARHDLTIIEDDIFADLAPGATVTLASLAGLDRVIYLGSFSKTVCPGLRAGFLLTTAARAHQLARAKVMTSLGSSALIEQMLLQILTQGHYRRHLQRLRDRLSSAHLNVAREFAARGVELAFAPASGLFVWARLPSQESVSKLWRLALSRHVLLAPGELFRPDGKATPYWRFNVAQCDSPRMFSVLDALR